MVIIFAMNGSVSYSQENTKKLVMDYFVKHYEKYQLKSEDVKNVKVTDEYKSKHNGVTHIYFRQLYNGIELINATANANISKLGRVLTAHHKFVNTLEEKVNVAEPIISALDAVQYTARYFDLNIKQTLDYVDQNLSVKNEKYIVSQGGISTKPIPVNLVYYVSNNGSVILSWNVLLHSSSSKNVWDVIVDASTGNVLYYEDHVVKDSYHEMSFVPNINPSSANHKKPTNKKAPFSKRRNTNYYNVYALPVESPMHGDRTLEHNSADSTASPYGWHDTDGIAGAEYFYTRGNNCFVYEDSLDNDSPGYYPTVGSDLTFDFPIDFSKDPRTYLDASITNLFYTNNIIHDILYQYGFDEVSGNFQANNYGNGGTGFDPVVIHAQDGGGTNNAYFYTYNDGTSPRMEVYKFNIDYSKFRIDSPSTISGDYIAREAAFGGALTSSPISGKVVIVDDNGVIPSEGCNTLVNSSEINGNIAFIRRGTCLFIEKVKNAQNAGAIAVVIANHIDGAPFTMTGTDNTINIPVIMISKEDGDSIEANLPNVYVTMSEGPEPTIRDGAFDNALIVHEYGHGISYRLIGGPSGICLGNEEQMGEGWSDWYSLMLTTTEDHTGWDPRGFVVYANAMAIDGIGWRPKQYSIDRSINNVTYDDLCGQRVPHGVGWVWASTLWDLTWAFVDQYGYDPDIYNGNGGNNMALQLITDGLKFLACYPGMVDGRDAILAADSADYNGANQCLIWSVFAKRGLGYSADQGSNYDICDGVAAFDLPPGMSPPSFTDDITLIGDSSLCIGDTVMLVAPSGYSNYVWVGGNGVISDTLIVTSSGTYSVSIKDSMGCLSDVTKSVEISVNSASLKPEITTNNTADSLFVDNIAGNYMWYFQDSLITDSTYVISPPADGNYKVVRSSGNCISDTSNPFTFNYIQHPFPDSNAIWSVLDCWVVWYMFSSSTHCLTTNYKMDGDTIIDSIAYKQLLSTNDSLQLNQSFSYTGAIRYKDGKVYYRNSYQDSEALMYDFTVRRRDSIEINGFYAVLDSVSTILINNDERRAYSFKYGNSPTYMYEKETWIEGIGSMSSFIDPFWGNYPDASTELLCYTVNGNLFYDNPEYSTCYIKYGVGVEDKGIIGIDFNIYPNPNTGTFVIEFLGQLNKVHKLKMFDITGKLIFSDKLTVSNTRTRKEINLWDCKKGIYILKVISDGGVVTKRVVYR